MYLFLGFVMNNCWLGVVLYCRKTITKPLVSHGDRKTHPISGGSEPGILNSGSCISPNGPTHPSLGRVEFPYSASMVFCKYLLLRVLGPLW